MLHIFKWLLKGSLQLMKHGTIVFMLCGVFSGFGQKPINVDSLRSVLKNAETEQQKLLLALDFSEKIFRGNPKDALEFAALSLELAQKSNSDSLLYRANHNLGSIYLLLGNYPRALQLYNVAINHGSKLVDKSILARPLGNVGSIYYYQKDYPNALKYYKQALSYFPSTIAATDVPNLSRKASVLSNIGIIFDETKKYDAAEKYYREALILARLANDHEQIGNILNNQGTLLRDLGQYDSAFARLQEAMAIRQARNNTFGVARSFNNIGQFLLEQRKDYAQAELYLNKAIALGRELHSLNTIKDASYNLYTLHQTTGNFKKALEAFQINRAVHDSLFNEESTRKIAQLEMQFEFDRQQAELLANQKARENYYLLGGAALVLLLIAAVQLYFLQRGRSRRLELEQTRLSLEQTNLKNQLLIKDKELATNIMNLINKNELINNISEKLLEVKTAISPDSQQAVQKVVLDLQSSVQPELWQEFDYRFKQVHERFYNVLTEKFPDLTPNERRLCAFLKLNMTTKEISAITHQNAKSIDVARTRLRKKLNLTGTDQNLVLFLENLGSSEK